MIRLRPLFAAAYPVSVYMVLASGMTHLWSLLTVCGMGPAVVLNYSACEGSCMSKMKSSSSCRPAQEQHRDLRKAPSCSTAPQLMLYWQMRHALLHADCRAHYTHQPDGNRVQQVPIYCMCYTILQFVRCHEMLLHKKWRYAY